MRSSRINRPERNRFIRNVICESLVMIDCDAGAFYSSVVACVKVIAKPDECFMDKDEDFNYIKPCDKRLRVWSISR